MADTKETSIWRSYAFISLAAIVMITALAAYCRLWVLMAIPIGFLFGFFLQKGDLCAASAFSEILIMKDRLSHGLRGRGKEDVQTRNVSPHIAAQEPIKPKAFINGIPDVIQMNSFSCGVAVVQAVATYYGRWGYQEECADQLGTTPAEGRQR